MIGFGPLREFVARFISSVVGRKTRPLVPMAGIATAQALSQLPPVHFGAVSVCTPETAQNIDHVGTAKIFSDGGGGALQA